jgi:hypothetical protein
VHTMPSDNMQRDPTLGAAQISVKTASVLMLRLIRRWYVDHSLLDGAQLPTHGLHVLDGTVFA